MKTDKTFTESQKGTKYSFVGRPDFNRIIRENEGAEVIIVSREDGLVTFLFRLGHGWEKLDDSNPNIFRRAEKEFGFYPFGLTSTGHNGEKLPSEWAAFWTDHRGSIVDLRRIAQYIVRARTGKHTVEVLP